MPSAGRKIPFWPEFGVSTDLPPDALRVEVVMVGDQMPIVALDRMDDYPGESVLSYRVRAETQCVYCRKWVYLGSAGLAALRAAEVLPGCKPCIAERGLIEATALFPPMRDEPR